MNWTIFWRGRNYRYVEIDTFSKTVWFVFGIFEKIKISIFLTAHGGIFGGVLLSNYLLLIELNIGLSRC